VVIAKPGLDGHDRGAKIIARALRDAGMEVIYTGLHQTPEQIVETAIQEDADAVGISILSGAHMTLVPRILDGLRENGAEDVLVVVGGTIPTEDAKELKQLGVAEVFTPGAPTSSIVEFLRARASQPEQRARRGVPRDPRSVEWFQAVVTRDFEWTSERVAEKRAKPPRRAYSTHDWVSRRPTGASCSAWPGTRVSRGSRRARSARSRG
jgi:methylmalonyl-CoA mutase, C-terminal domain